MLPIEITRYKTLFLQTAWDYLRNLDNSLIALKANPEYHEAQESLYISAHSLKGQSQVMNYPGISKLCHDLEVVFRDVKDGKRILSQEDFTLLTDAVEALKKSLAEISAHDREADVSEIQKAASHRFALA
jgi:two-component system, chemotaxis family, sensor kinase CheA